MRQIALKSLFALAAVVIVAAPADAQSRKRGDQTKITRADIDEAGAAVVTAYDAVRLLRPRWLQPPIGKAATGGMLGGGAGSGPIIVYVDESRQPDLQNALQRVKGAEIIEMKYLDQNRAVQEYGPGHESGVIEVTTVRRRP